MEQIEKLAEERRRLMDRLNADLDVDEDHRWRARTYRKLAEIEDAIADLEER